MSTQTKLRWEFIFEFFMAALALVGASFAAEANDIVFLILNLIFFWLWSGWAVKTWKKL